MGSYDRAKEAPGQLAGVEEKRSGPKTLAPV